MKLPNWWRAAYYRFRWLWPIFLSQAARRFWRVVAWLGAAAGLLLFAFIWLLRFEIMPNIGMYQARIEQSVGKMLGAQVAIRHLDAYWNGIHPGLDLQGVELRDSKGRIGLQLEAVRAELSWRSLLHLTPVLHDLRLDAPMLVLRRDSKGRLAIAGLAAQEGEADPAVADWLLLQSQVQIHHAELVWQDELRRAPPLVLAGVEFTLKNAWDTHKFSLSAEPPAALGQRLQVDGELEGESFAAPEDWTGKANVEIRQIKLEAWAPWLSYPFGFPDGQGSLHAELTLGDYGWSINTNLAMNDVQLRLGAKLPELVLSQIVGRVGLSKQGERWRLYAKQLRVQSANTPAMPPANFTFEWQQTLEGNNKGKADVERLDVAALTHLSQFIPLDATSRRLLHDYAPRGLIEGFQAAWEGNSDSLKRYQIKTRFNRLFSQAVGIVPGIQGLSGYLEANEKGGYVTLQGKNAAIDLPAVFAESLVPLSSLDAEVHWQLDEKGLHTQFKRVRFANADASGKVDGRYDYLGKGPGTIDLQGHVQGADAKAVWRYLPLVIGEQARTWVRHALQGGRAKEADVVLRGNLDDFPFSKPDSGKFEVKVKAEDVTLEYLPGWPKLEQIHGDLRFSGAGMFIESKQAKTLGVKILQTKVEIPDLANTDAQLLIKGQITGATSEFLRFLDESPVAGWLGHFTQDMRAQGEGELALDLAIPLHHAVDSKVKGDFHFLPGNQLTVVPLLPPVHATSGHLLFTEKSAHSQDLVGTFLGAPLRVDVSTDAAGHINTVVHGGVQASQAQQEMGWSILDALHGSSTWKAEIHPQQKGAEIVVESNLLGISSRLPAPLNKTAETPLALRVVRGSVSGMSGVGEVAGRSQFLVNLGNLLEARLYCQSHAEAGCVLERGAISVGKPLDPAMPEKVLSLTLPKLEAEAWQHWLLPTQPKTTNKGEAAAATSATTSVWSPEMKVMVQTPLLLAQGRRFEGVTLQIHPQSDGWEANIRSRQAEGNLLWHTQGAGVLKANFNRLYLLSDKDSETSTVGSQSTPAVAPGELIDELPGLDITVQDFRLNERNFGRLHVLASNDVQGWRINQLALDNPDGRMRAAGLWQNRQGKNNTELSFDLNTDNAGDLLDRLGYPGALKRGKAQLQGKVNWQGGPSRLDYASLNGEISLHASQGQFAKVEPGIGKLLGLISLQSLPRRITLDFRDIFSEGFAFDAVNSRVVLRQGVLRTAEDLRIEGPAARILMQGETNLEQETQQLHVSIQPELGGVAALGVAAAHPVVGVATLVVSKILRNPLDKLFAFRYKITGTWDDPNVEKIGISRAGAEE